MSSTYSNLENVTLAMFTVCADASLARMAQHAPRHIPGLAFAGEFHDYITADRRPHFPHVVSNSPGCVALIDFDRHSDHAVETAETLRNLPSMKITSVGVSSQIDTALLLRAMRAGCGEFIEKPLEAESFEETLRGLERRLRRVLIPSTRRGRVIALFGVKGGVGATTLAVHLASYLASYYGKATLLIDHQRQLGHVGLHLGLKEGRYHFDELIWSAERLDADFLKGFIVRHRSGLDVMVAPEACEVRDSGASNGIKHVFDFLRQEYDYVVIDSSLAYREITAATIQYSDEFYLVVTPEVAALRDLARHAQKLSLGEKIAKKPRIVVNRAASGDAIGTSQIEQAVGLPVSVRIPNSYAELVRAINSGEPIPPRRSSGFVTQIKKWAGHICGDSGFEEPRVGGLMGRLAFWN